MVLRGIVGGILGSRVNAYMYFAFEEAFGEARLMNRVRAGAFVGSESGGGWVKGSRS